MGDPGATLTIRLDPGASPIAGVVGAGGEETPFVGWIQLAGLIEALHSEASDGDDPAGSDPNPASGPSPARSEADRGR